VKGWAATRALADLRTAGVGAAMVNAGGDIAVCGRPEPTRPWRVGIRHPDDALRCLCVVTAATESGTAAVATSGTYERGDHVIDPHRGRPATGTVSASVVGPDLALADALATALVAAGPEGLAMVAALPGYTALIVGSDGTPVVTDGFPWIV
jgi:thiamine biosynthesis lipoprotein